jgi:hypothetical protein
MPTNLSYQNLKTGQYVEALLKCSGKKVCTKLAKSINMSHDLIYRSFNKPITKTKEVLNELKRMALRSLNQDELHLIFDDTQITKLYAKEIEGLAMGFDGSLGMSTMGIKMVTALLTDRKHNIPIDAIPFISKEFAQSNYKTKSEIAIGITRLLINVFKFRRILGDAHYATKQMLHFLNDGQLNYLMKIPCNRVVTIGKSTGQLKRIFRLKKNAHVQSIKGTFDGIKCYFYIVKVKDGTTVYLISNDKIDPYEVINIYRIRWNIEIFHRIAKQYLGMNDCQMRTIEKQRQHVICVMLAYAIANFKKTLMNLDCTEHVINYIRDVKQLVFSRSKTAPEGNLCYVA